MKNIIVFYIAVTAALSFVCQTSTAQVPPDSLMTKRDSLTTDKKDSLKTGKKRNADKNSLETAKFTDEYLDTVRLDKRFVINDYSLFGVEYGASLCRMSFNPSKTQTNIFVPNTFGVFYTRYGKMFSYLPYFGFKVGVRYSHEGYKFKENKDTHETPVLEGATQAVIDLAEVPFMAHFHIDVLHFKVMADAGIYGGYRLSINRTGDNVPVNIKNSFLDTDRRLDYGLCGGVGFGLVFDPLEFHVNANVRYSWGTLYDPDYNSQYYYRFAYPFDVMVTAGIYFQLTRRTGKTKPELRREAYDQVYHNIGNTSDYENSHSEGR